MRPTIFRAVLSVLLVFLAPQCPSIAQSQPPSRKSHKSGTRPASAHSVLSPLQAPPPNTTDSWTGAGDGTSWNNAGNWNSGIPNSSTVDVTIGTTTATVNDNIGASVGNLTLSHSGDALTIADGITLNVFGGTISNAGTITLNSTNAFGTALELSANTTLSGGGTITMANGPNNLIEGAVSTDTLTNQETIQGAGNIGNGRMTLVNSGTIDANQTTPLVVQASGTTINTGTMEATAGATLTLQSSTITNTGGTISANASKLVMNSSIVNGGAVTLTGASTLQMNSSTIHGGSTLTNTATGLLEVTGNSTLGGAITNPTGGVMQIDDAATLNLEGGTYANLGTVTLNSTNAFGTALNITGNVTLSGGTVTMANGPNNFIEGATTATTLTNQETIQGAGNIGNGRMTLVNSGTINANQTTPLVIQASGTTINTGTMEATAGATLTLQSSTITNTGGAISANASKLVMNSSIVNGGAVTLTGASTLQLNSGTIHGGSTLTNTATGLLEVTGNSTLGGAVTNPAGGVLQIDDAATLNLEGGTYANLGTVTLNSTNAFGTALNITGNVTLSGGTVTMANGANNFIQGAASTFVLANAETIQGAGNIGNGSIGVVNSGTILANASNNLIINVSGANFNNTGTIEAAGGTLTIQGPGTTFFTNDNQATNTLTGGTYIANGNNIQWAAGSGGITTLAAKVVEEGGGQLINTSTGNSNVLAGLTSITSGGALTIGGVPFTNAGSFSNAGSLTILSGESFSVGSLAQISGGTLTGGTYVLDANLSLSGATQNITTNTANLTLAGGTIENANSTNALAALASNTKTLTIAGTGNNVATTAPSFSNAGTLTINSGDSFTAPALTQITASTLSAGTYVLAGNLDLTTNGINITKNSATLTLEGGTINSNGSNALAALAANTKNLTIAGTGTNVVTTAASFSNTGTITINSGDSFTAPALTQISGTALSAGTYVLAGNLDLTTAANITTNSAKLTLEGGTIQTGSTNDLANLSSNTGSLTLANNAPFATVGSFTNSGTLTVNKGSKFTVTTGTLTNLSGGTLASGTYVIGGTLLVPAANGGIVTNAANLTLTGSSAKISDGTANALAGFNNNTGTFALSTGAAFSAAASNFTNSGSVTIAKGTTLTVPGTSNIYSQTVGQTTIDGALAGISGGANITGGTILGSGTIKGKLSVGNASGNAATINVGDSAKAGLLSITGTYTQLATGAMTGLINGTTVGSGFSQVQVTGTAALAGTINFSVAASFQSSLTLGESFTALTASSVTGAFSNSTIAINSSFHFVVSYTSTGVVLTVASGPVAPPNSSGAARSAALASILPAKSVVTSKRTPLVHVSGLRQPLGASRTAQNLLVAGWERAPGHSNAILGRAPEMRGLRVWEHPPVTTLVSANTVSVPRARSAANSSAANSIPAHLGAPSMNRGLGQNNAIGTRSNLRGWMGAFPNRHVPLKMMLPSAPRFGR
jgi:fibronectin-binding autotransporter adhesin